MTKTEIQKFSDVITLRGHHLLCIQGFQGYGYTEEFVENLGQIINLLKKKPLQKIRIVTECDDICSSCPFNEGNSCVTPSGTDKIIKTMDQAVIDYFNLDLNLDYFYKEIQEQVLQEDHFYDLKKICGTCTWRNNCKFYKKEE